MVSRTRKRLYRRRTKRSLCSRKRKRTCHRVKGCEYIQKRGRSGYCRKNRDLKGRRMRRRSRRRKSYRGGGSPVVKFNSMMSHYPGDFKTFATSAANAAPLGLWGIQHMVKNHVTRKDRKHHKSKHSRKRRRR